MYIFCEYERTIDNSNSVAYVYCTKIYSKLRLSNQMAIKFIFLNIEIILKLTYRKALLTRFRSIESILSKIDSILFLFLKIIKN